MKIPPGIDSAMWEVVESGDQKLMDEFAARYPEHKGELSKRLTMVRSLKESKPRADAAPTFKVKPGVDLPESTSRWTTTTVMLAIVGAALATFGLVRIYDQLTAPKAPVASTAPPTYDPDQDLRRYLPQTNPQQNQTTPPATTQETTKPPANPEQPDPFQRNVTIATEGQMLSAILQDIATQANLVLEAAPGMPEEEIRAEYINVPAIKVLEDLGATFGFTPVIQARRHALLIPARDRSDRNPPPVSDPNRDTADPNASISGPVNPRSSGDGTLPPIGR